MKISTKHLRRISDRAITKGTASKGVDARFINLGYGVGFKFHFTKASAERCMFLQELAASEGLAPDILSSTLIGFKCRIYAHREPQSCWGYLTEVVETYYERRRRESAEGGSCEMACNRS